MNSYAVRACEVALAEVHRILIRKLKEHSRLSSEDRRYAELAGAFRRQNGSCGIGAAIIGSIPHKDLRAAFGRLPSVGFAIWRETLIDGVVFREAITNNSARTMRARMGHLFCELLYRTCFRFDGG
jgi:hypothetical protein